MGWRWLNIPYWQNVCRRYRRYRRIAYRRRVCRRVRRVRLLNHRFRRRVCHPVNRSRYVNKPFRIRVCKRVRRIRYDKRFYHVKVCTPSRPATPATTYGPVSSCQAGEKQLDACLSRAGSRLAACNCWVAWTKVRYQPGRDGCKAHSSDVRESIEKTLKSFKPALKPTAKTNVGNGGAYSRLPSGLCFSAMRHEIKDKSE